MPILKLFPTIIEHINNKEFTDKVLPISNEILKGRPDSHYGYPNTHLDEQVNQKIQSYSFISEYLNQIANNFLEKIDCKSPFPLYLDTFTSVMDKGDTHGAHIHHNCILSGVCYLEVPPNSASITFEDHKDARKYNGLIPIKDTENNSGVFHFNPKEGDILIWESWVRHGIYSNGSDGRKTLVFNFYR